LVDIRREFVVAQIAGDRRRALSSIDRALDAGASIASLQDHVVRAAQHAIGELWEKNEIGVAEEHMATAIAEAALARLQQSGDRSAPTGHTIVVACVEGELHSFPARLVAAALELDGHAVRFLGADVPLESLCSLVDRERPDLVALSVTMTFHVPALVRAISTLQGIFPDVSLAIGGRAFDSPGSPWPGVSSCGGDASTLVGQVPRLVSERASLSLDR
jgi:methanogenic corrinoid protein MtbC1